VLCVCLGLGAWETNGWVSFVGWFVESYRVEKRGYIYFMIMGANYCNKSYRWMDVYEE
jgi:hypothetical protein